MPKVFLVTAFIEVNCQQSDSATIYVLKVVPKCTTNIKMSAKATVHIKPSVCDCVK